MMVKLRVLMFCPQFRPLIGGAERQAEKLAISLAAAGCEVILITPRIDLTSPDVEEIQGVRIERFPMTDLSRRCLMYQLYFGKSFEPLENAYLTLICFMLI
jgi:hypothetical protein